MNIDSRIAGALRPFANRALIVRAVRALTVGLLLTLIASQAARVTGFLSYPILASLLGAALVGAVAYAAWDVPALIAIARRIDQRASLDDLIVTALGCARDTGISSVVYKKAVEALSGVAPAEVYPMESPRHWRRWAAAAVVAQVVLVPLAWQAPSVRPQSSGLTGMSLPPGEAGAESSAKTNPKSSREGAASAVPSDPSLAGSTTTVANAGLLGPEPTGRLDAAGSGESGQLRLAAARDANEPVERVPLAMRGVVARYFKSIQSQGKR